ncbi:HNH endonuclease [Laceyella tengchongensis]
MKEVYNRAQKDEKLRAQFTEEELNPLKVGKDLSRFTWYHHQTPGRMQLVLTDIHGKVRHTGGREIWGGGEQGRFGKLDPS